MPIPSSTTTLLLAAFLPLCVAGPIWPHHPHDPLLVTRDAICASKGYDTGNDGYYYSNEGTFPACSGACRRDGGKCKSFSFGNGECNLYAVPVAGNFAQDSTSPYTFFDSSCSNANPPPTTTTKSTTTTKTNPTTTTTNKKSPPPTTTPKPLPTTTTTTTTTSKPAKPTTTTTSTSATTPPCPYPTWTIHSFKYTNSSQNLDCAGSDHDNPLCYTGRPPQPEGYGPPDSVSLVVDGIGNCFQSNPGSVPLRSIGNDVVRCAGSSKQVSFFGSSNTANSKAVFQVQNPVSCPDGRSYTAYGEVKVDMSCTYDSGWNATCLISPATVKVVPSRFDGVYGGA